MLPPILEIYVVWHPDDTEGEQIAQEIIEHFHGNTFTGLIGGAVEVFIRSHGWDSAADAPRPIPHAKSPPPNNIEPARFTVVVPLLGRKMAAAVEDIKNSWHKYIQEIAEIQKAIPEWFGIFPYILDARVKDNTKLSEILGHIQTIAANPPDLEGESNITLRCRDLSQAIAQFLSGDDKQLTVFISHTKRHLSGAEDSAALISLIKEVINNTHLKYFFDARDLQPGKDWNRDLEEYAKTSALLAVRTDLYPSREWCQREMLISKWHGMPVIIIDALKNGEERGSFLMDHVPRLPARMENGFWQKKDIYRTLNLLVDQCLKRELWKQQEKQSAEVKYLGIAWWASHAPEPLTFVRWLGEAKAKKLLPKDGEHLRILHPDPPLSLNESIVLEQTLALIQPNSVLDIMTPRLLAARGG